MKQKPKVEAPCLNHLWWGFSIGGRHYNGSVKLHYHKYEMERWLSLKEAKQYAAEMGIRDMGVARANRVSNKFESLKDLEDCALKWCERYLGSDWLLFEDNYYNPERIIGGKGWATELIEPANELAAAWRKVGNTQRCDPKIYKPIYKVWNECIEKYLIPWDSKRPEIEVEKLKETWQK